LSVGERLAVQFHSRAGLDSGAAAAGGDSPAAMDEATQALADP